MPLRPPSRRRVKTMTTATAKPPIEPHEIHRDRLLAHAREMLDADDRVQASEKIWGALSHAVSDIAKRRQWPLGEEYIDKKDVARYIGEQADSPQISRLYSAVYSFHTNFHKDEEEPAVIGEGIDMAEELVGLLKDADAELPKSLGAPHGLRYRNYERRHGLEPNPPYTREELAVHLRRERARKASAEAAIERTERTLAGRGVGPETRARARGTR